jgi:hypothetical protein
MMIHEYDWTPPLDDLPEVGVLLLYGIRPLVPRVVGHIQNGHIDVTPDVSDVVDLGGSLGPSRFEIRGTAARPTKVGPRVALTFDYRGQVALAERTQPFAGSCTVDEATSAILDLRLSSPVQV